MQRSIRTIITPLMFGALAFAGGATQVAAQDGETEGFPLPANTAFCEPGYLGPFVGCTPWEGVTVAYTSADGTFNESCTTVAGERTASCSLQVPFGSTITASIDPSIIPAGYVLEGAASLTFEIPDGPPQGQFGGPSFVLLPEAETPAPAPTATQIPTTTPPTATEVPTPGTLSLTADAAFCEPGYLGPFVGCTPWEGVTVAFESTDAPISTTCETVATWERSATCGIPVPYGSTITVSIDPAVIPDGYVLEGSATQTIDVPDSPPDGVFGGAAFVLLPEGEDAEPVEPVEESTEEEPLDDGEITALPNTGTGTAREPMREAASLSAIVAAALILMAGANTSRRSAR